MSCCTVRTAIIGCTAATIVIVISEILERKIITVTDKVAEFTIVSIFVSSCAVRAAIVGCTAAAVIVVVSEISER